MSPRSLAQIRKVLSTIWRERFAARRRGLVLGRAWRGAAGRLGTTIWTPESSGVNWPRSWRGSGAGAGSGVCGARSEQRHWVPSLVSFGLQQHECAAFVAHPESPHRGCSKRVHPMTRRATHKSMLIRRGIGTDLCNHDRQVSTSGNRGQTPLQRRSYGSYALTSSRCPRCGRAFAHQSCKPCASHGRSE